MPSNAPPLKPKVREGEIGGMCMCVALAGHKFCGHLRRQPGAWPLTKQLVLSIGTLQEGSGGFANLCPGVFGVTSHFGSSSVCRAGNTVCAITQSCDVQMGSNT